jgi:carbamoyl-phosphate synthase large subunit
MMGEKLKDIGYGTGLFRKSAYYAVKVPAFSFEKLADVDTQLGPEMKSTGEVLGVARTLEEALVKGLVAAGYRNDVRGGVLFSVRDSDKPEAIRLAHQYARLGWTLYATASTAHAFEEAGMTVTHLPALNDNLDLTLSLLDSGDIRTVISTSSKGRIPTRASVRLRRKAVERSIPCLTSLDTASVLVGALLSKYALHNIELVDVARMRHEKTKLRFVKMRGSGNDYIYFDCFDQTVDSPESVSVQISSRRFGVGADGIVLIMPHESADAAMRMFNSDGTEAELAGNALRCVAKYLYESARVRKEEMTIHTEGGVKRARVYERAGVVESVRVSMGPVTFAPEKVPVLLDGEEVIDRLVTVGGAPARITCLSMGNPHCVLFVSDALQADVDGWGSRIERDPIFPQRVNVSFAQAEGRHTLRMRTWERGIGETLACGTGACAAAVAAVRLGILDPGDQTIHMPGGDLLVRVDGEDIGLTGDAVKDFEGIIEL